MALDRKKLEDVSKRLDNAELDEKKIDVKKDSITLMLENLSNEVGLSIAELKSINTMAEDDDNRQLLQDIKEKEKRLESKINQQRINAVKNLIMTKEIPDEIAKLHLDSAGLRKKLLEYYVGNDPQLLDQYGKENDIIEAVEDVFDKYNEKHVSLTAVKFIPEVKQFIVELEIPEEIAIEDLSAPQFAERLRELIKQKGGKELKDELDKHKELEDKLFGSEEIKNAQNNKFEVYKTRNQEVKLLEGIKEEMNKIEYTKDEKLNDALHNKPDDFAQFILEKKLSPERLAQLEKLSPEKRANFENKLRQHAKDKLYGNWLKEHEVAEKAEAKQKVISLIVDYKTIHTPPGMKDEFASEADFKAAMWRDALRVGTEKNKEWQEQDHAEMIKQLQNDAEVQGALKGRYDYYKNKFPEKAKAALEEELKNLPAKFSKQEISNDNYHNNRDLFAREMLEKIPQALRKKMESFKDLQNLVNDQLKGTVYDEWLKKHETAEAAEKKTAFLEAAKDPLPEELASQDLNESEFALRYFDILAAKDSELQDPKHKGIRDLLARDPELQAVIKERFKEYQEAKEGKLLEGIKEEMSNIKYAEKEKLNDELHNKPDDFAQFVLEKKLSPERLAQLEKLSPEKRGNLENKLRQYAKDKLYGNWLKEHEAAEKAEAKKKLVELISSKDDIHTPTGMKDEFASEADFKAAMWRDTLKVGTEKNKEWQESDHADMLKELENDAEVNGALKGRYDLYKNKYPEKAKAELESALNSLPANLSKQDIDNDNYHDNKDLFARDMYEKIPEALRKKIGPFKDLQNLAKEQLKGSVYDQWLKQHETAEEKKFTKELEEKIMGQEITAEFASTHYEEGEFKTAWFDLIKDGLSDDLKGEHQEELEKLLGKDRVEKAFSAKFEAYETMHDAAMEKKFSAELSELISRTDIPPEMAAKDFSEDAFKTEWFAALLKNASPELREELQEHSGLQAKLFASQPVQQSLDDAFDKYEAKHGESTEKKVSEELAPVIAAAKMEPKKMKQGLSEDQFAAIFMEQLWKTNPALQKNVELQKKLLKNPKVKAEIAKKYAEYQNGAKQPVLAKEPDQAKVKEETKLKKTVSESEEEKAEKAEAKESADKAKKAPKNQLSAEQLEEATDSDFSKGLDKVVDMNKGQERLQELKKLPFLKNILRKAHIKRGMEPFIIEWASQIKDSDFRLFKQVLMRRGTTPQKMMQLMTVSPLRRKAINRIKKFSPQTWIKFSQSLKYLDMKSQDLLQPGLKMQTDALKATPEETRSASLLEREDEGNEISESLEETDEMPAEEVSEGVEGGPVGQATEIEEVIPVEEKTNQFEAEIEEEMDQLKPAEADEATDDLPEENEVIEPLLEAEPESDAFMAELEMKEPVLEKKLNLETSIDQEVQAQPPLQLEENEAPAEPIAMIETEPEEAALKPEPEQPSETAEQEELTPNVLTEQEAVEETHLEQTEVQPEVKAEMIFEDQPANQEKAAKEISKTVETSADEEMVSVATSEEEPPQVKAEVEPETPQADQMSTAVPLTSTLLQQAEEEKNQPLSAQKPTEELKTDPLKELEKFRKQLMGQFKQNARLSQMQKTLEMLGVNIDELAEMPNEETSEFLESLRIEMETNSMSLKSLLQKFIRFLRFATDFEIPSEIEIPASTQERLVANPGEVFKALSDYYFECRERHEKRTDLVFRLEKKVRLSESEATLVFEVHKNEIPETCSALIPCQLVAEEEKKVPVAA